MRSGILVQRRVAANLVKRPVITVALKPMAEQRARASERRGTPGNLLPTEHLAGIVGEHCFFTENPVVPKAEEKHGT